MSAGTLTLLFCRSHTVGSWLMRQLSRSDWSHVGILEPDGQQVLEATWPRVRRATLAQFLNGKTEAVPVTFPCADPDAAIAWAAAQIGKPYDWRGLFSFVFHSDWAHPGQWWCSEYAAMAAQQGNSPLVRPGATNRVAPQHLWMLPGQVDLPLLLPIPPEHVNHLGSILSRAPEFFRRLGDGLSKEQHAMSLHFSHVIDLMKTVAPKMGNDIEAAGKYATAAATAVESAAGDSASANHIAAILKGIAAVATPVAEAAQVVGTATSPALTAVQLASLPGDLRGPDHRPGFHHDRGHQLRPARWISGPSS